MNMCVVTMLKCIVHVFIPVGMLLMMVQLPVMMCNCMARKSRITLNRNRCMHWTMSRNLHRHRHWSSRLIAIWILGMMVVPQTKNILPRMIVGRESKKRQRRWMKQGRWRIGRVKEGRIHRWKETLWNRCSKDTTSLKEVRLWDISLRGALCWV